LQPKLIVLRTLVETGKQCPGLGRDDSCFMVFASELADSIQVQESHDRDKLNLVAEIAT